ncbi:hypothetical protein [Microlunatus antarcticus]|uniref:Uncharacterized protein n=1 Tax=Microlunatus antarcticus TaxID=53388 RepID=A0A7W5JXA4_9ACTN|nr:hypothetical protein [Microlunatus antarcticus]MBB3328019.1 hypothetical protein [Microlunatus antarcticus]
MTRRYSTASAAEARSATDLLRTQGYQAESDDHVVVLQRDTVEAVELLLRRAPTARLVP